MNQTADHVAIVCNPNAGQARRRAQLLELVACLGQRGLSTELITDIDNLDRAVDGWFSARLRAIVAAGGDGTVAEVVNRVPPEVPVTVFPLGTANLLARYLGIRADPRSMAELLATGATVRLDAASANGRVFLLMLGCGFDADVVDRLHRHRIGRRMSYWTWARPIFQSMSSYRFPALRVRCDPPAACDAAAVRWAFVVNLPMYPARLCVAPQADGTDGLLDVCTLAKGSLWHGLHYAAFVAAGRAERLADLSRGLATHIRIESSEPVAYQLDGDPGGLLPVEVEVLPKRLTLWASRERVGALASRVVSCQEDR